MSTLQREGDQRQRHRQLVHAAACFGLALGGGRRRR